MTVERRHVSPYVDGRLVAAEDAPPADFGVGRRCVEPGCGANVNRYSAAAPDGPRCGLHWTLGDEYQLALGQGGNLRVVKRVEGVESPQRLEELRVDHEIELACEAGVRLDTPMSLYKAGALLHLAPETLAKRVGERGLVPASYGSRDVAQYRLGALVGLPGFDAVTPPLIQAA